MERLIGVGAAYSRGLATAVRVIGLGSLLPGGVSSSILTLALLQHVSEVISFSKQAILQADMNES